MLRGRGVGELDAAMTVEVHIYETRDSHQARVSTRRPDLGNNPILDNYVSPDELVP